MGRKGKETTAEERKIVLRLHQENKSYAEIAKVINRSRYTIRNIIKRFQGGNSLRNRHRTGRPRKITEREERKIVRTVKKKPKITASEISAMLRADDNLNVHSETVRRALKRAGLSSRIARKKPLISKKNKKLRKEFAIEYIRKTEDFWDTVMFSDESKFNIFHCDGRVRVWRKPKCELDADKVQATVKHGGGGAMIWGCMASSGVGELVFIDGIMDKMIYLDILKNNLKTSAQRLNLGANWRFQQDNDPKHTAHVVKQWILYNTPHTLSTPPQSPDMNPIEHLWAELENRIRRHHISSKPELKRILSEEWAKIDSDVTRKLVHSMPNRLREVLRQKGGSTKY